MRHDLDEITQTFHERARSTFFSIYQSYIRTLSSMNRQVDENVYQQSSNRYCAELRYHLQSITRELLERSPPTVNRNELNSVLSFLSVDYEREFEQKIKSL